MDAKSANFTITPGENEQIQTVVNLPKENRSILYGIVKDHNCQIVKDAVVRLFEQQNPQDENSLDPISYTFTDRSGQFVFGPLIASRHYVVKVSVNHVKIREAVIYSDINNVDISNVTNSSSVNSKIQDSSDEENGAEFSNINSDNDEGDA